VKFNFLSLRPSYPYSLLPIENNSPCFESINVNDAPQFTDFINISKLKLLGLATIFLRSCLLGSFPWPSYPLKSHPYE
jgi:hypothetical protein